MGIEVEETNLSHLGEVSVLGKAKCSISGHLSAYTDFYHLALSAFKIMFWLFFHCGQSRSHNRQLSFYGLSSITTEIDTAVDLRGLACFVEGLCAREFLLGTFCSTCSSFGLWKDSDFYSRLLAEIQMFPYISGLLSMINHH